MEIAERSRGAGELARLVFGQRLRRPRQREHQRRGPERIALAPDVPRAHDRRLLRANHCSIVFRARWHAPTCSFRSPGLSGL
jgi:hypothetical protein